MTDQKHDYQSTLNLPNTKFSMKANLAQREPSMLEFWQTQNIYEKIQKKNANGASFLLHDGPPYANGHIHIGHAVNKILKDIVVKAKGLSGYSSPYIPGWDCHGLPIELNVEKKIGKAGKDVSPIQFTQACRTYALTQWQQQREEFIRLGVFADWQHPYLTMDYAFEANIIRTLAKIYQNGFVQQGRKPVYWCTDCASALAEAEVEYENKKSSAIDVRFSVIDVPELLARMGTGVAEAVHRSSAPFEVEFLNKSNVSVVIWTTTPWTLPANQAVALHAEYSYVLVQHDDEYFILAEGLLTQCMERYAMAHYEVLGHCTGAALAGLMLKHPLYDRHVPIVVGEHVTLDAGTGAVHTAPVHGVDDYYLGIKYQLPIENYLNGNGVFLATTPLFAGLHLTAACDAIIQCLTEQHKLVFHEEIHHSYPHCWRHKKPLIFMATPQWFVSMEAHELRTRALAAIDTVQWIPEWGKNRIHGMINERPDWCISRQRTWGVPLAIFIDKHTAAPHPKTPELMLEVANFVEQHGLEIWLGLRTWLQNPHTEDKNAPLMIAVQQLRHAVCAIGGETLFEQYQPIPDSLDVWFNSGASYACVLQHDPRVTFPADLYLEGSDQHRGWFQTSLLSAVAHTGLAPYRQVLTHGFTVDEKGRKMSKSLGNVIAPEKVVKTFGADILRLWVASTDYRAEISVSDQILQRIADCYRRIRNTARFLLANLFDFEPTQHLIPMDQLVALDRYIIVCATELQEKIIGHYDNYEFHQVFQKLHHFCSEALGSFYLDVIKDRQYTMPTQSHGRRSAQTAMFHLIHALCRWMAPILSFTAEEIWQHIPKQNIPEGFQSVANRCRSEDESTKSQCHNLKDDGYGESVFLSEWYAPCSANIVQQQKPPADGIDWPMLLTVRDIVNKKIEELRNQAILGSALEADVTLFCSDEVAAQLQKFGEELKFIFITSQVTVMSFHTKSEQAVMTEIPGLAIAVCAINFAKCQRCWHRSADVGQQHEHPNLCQRCISNISGSGEVRQFA